MLILLDCRPLQYAGPDSEKSRLIFSAVADLTAERGIKWLFITDHTYRPGLFPELPIGRVLTRRAFPGRAGWKLWFDWLIPRLARQQGADLVMLTAGIAAAVSVVPQCLWMPESADPAEGNIPWRYPSIYPGRLAVSLRRASTVFCYADRDRAFLTGLWPEGKDRMHVLTPYPTHEIPLLSPEEKGRVKTARTQGKEYFLADLSGAAEEGVLNLLKAFSLFKKRQNSSMRLVLTGGISGLAGGLKDQLKTYKYRQDLYWIEGGEGLSELIGAAYAVLYPFPGNSLGIKLLNTWAAGVPVIAVNAGPLQEIAAGAALGFVAGDPVSLSAQLMVMYKDESLRGELVRKGLERAGGYSRDRFLHILQEAMGRELIKFADNEL